MNQDPAIEWLPRPLGHSVLERPSAAPGEQPSGRPDLS